MKKSLWFGFLVLALGLCSSQVSEVTKGSDNANCKVTMVLLLESELTEPIPLNPGIFGKRLCAIRVEPSLTGEAGALADGAIRRHEINTADGEVRPEKNSHVIEFYEFRDGLTAIHESKPADDGAPLLLGSLQETKTLAEKFRALCPNKAVPQALIEADERSACARIQDSIMPKVTEPMVLPELPTAMPQAYTQMTTCSPDYYRDNWGCQWFQNLCWGVDILFRRCNQSVVDYYTWTEMDIMIWNTMNGDFWNSQLSEGYHRDCFIGCWWTRWWSYLVKPRYLDCWDLSLWNGYWNDNWYFHSSNPCGHLHCFAEARPSIWDNH